MILSFSFFKSYGNLERNSAFKRLASFRTWTGAVLVAKVNYETCNTGVGCLASSQSKMALTVRRPDTSGNVANEALEIAKSFPRFLPGALTGTEEIYHLSPAF